MAKFKSKYAELSFYSEGSRKKFYNGEYETNDKKEIEVLESIIDAVRVDEPKAEVKQETKAEEKKESPRRSNTRKKSSAK